MEENLSINPEVEAFRDKYPAIAHEILKVYRFPEYTAKFNAKLIDVESGRIDRSPLTALPMPSLLVPTLLQGNNSDGIACFSIDIFLTGF